MKNLLYIWANNSKLYLVKSKQNLFLFFFSGTSTSGSHSSGPRRARPTPNTNYLHHSNSEGATSPNESDNTYAEATLLQPNNPRPIRYGQYYVYTTICSGIYYIAAS